MPTTLGEMYATSNICTSTRTLERGVSVGSPVPDILPTVRGCLLFVVEEVLRGLLEFGKQELGGESSFLPVTDTSLREGGRMVRRKGGWKGGRKVRETRHTRVKR